MTIGTWTYELEDDIIRAYNGDTYEEIICAWPECFKLLCETHYASKARRGEV